MNASFEEKSVWIQLLSIVVLLGSYLVNAAPMLANGVTALPPFVPLFIAAVVLMVVMLIAGHIVVAIHSRPEGRDERDQLIEWRAESNSGWVLAVGVLAAFHGFTELHFHLHFEPCPQWDSGPIDEHEHEARTQAI